NVARGAILAGHGSHAVAQAGPDAAMPAAHACERAADAVVAVKQDPAVARAVGSGRHAGLCRPGWV
ncbi:MAG TPA: hypothetical protein VF951_13190, partial [Streptosporangiaceae bacterium]